MVSMLILGQLCILTRVIPDSLETGKDQAFFKTILSVAGRELRQVGRFLSLEDLFKVVEGAEEDDVSVDYYTLASDREEKFAPVAVHGKPCTFQDCP